MSAGEIAAEFRRVVVGGQPATAECCGMPVFCVERQSGEPPHLPTDKAALGSLRSIARSLRQGLGRGSTTLGGSPNSGRRRVHD